MLYKVPYKLEGFILVDAKDGSSAIDAANLSLHEDVSSYLCEAKFSIPVLVEEKI